MSDLVVFVGPSLDAQALEHCQALSFRPPASQGDVYRAVSSRARAIGLVDGYFESVPAVWHKEILFALHRGVRVYGAASMGALRAAELHMYGMRGVGKIFDWYASGRIDADDEVALAHGPAELGYVALSVPMVNVRATLDRAVAERVLDVEHVQSLLAAARSIHFKERTWSKLLSAADLTAETRRILHAWLPKGAVDQKKQDAKELISIMTRDAEHWPGPHEADFLFEETDAWLAGRELFETISDFDREVVQEARLDARDYSGMLACATSAVLAASFPIEALGLRELSQLMDRFRIENQLQDSSRFHHWLARNALDAETLRAILCRRAVARRILDNSQEAVAAELLAEIKLRGRYEALAKQAGEKRKTGRVQADTKMEPSLSASWPPVILNRKRTASIRNG